MKDKKEVATVRKDDAGSVKQNESISEAINNTNREGCLVKPRIVITYIDDDICYYYSPLVVEWGSETTVAHRLKQADIKTFYLISKESNPLLIRENIFATRKDILDNISLMFPLQS